MCSKKLEWLFIVPLLYFIRCRSAVDARPYTDERHEYGGESRSEVLSAARTYCLDPNQLKCYNGGICVEVFSEGETFYRYCVCPYGYHGRQCQYAWADFPEIQKFIERHGYYPHFSQYIRTKPAAAGVDVYVGMWAFIITTVVLVIAVFTVMLYAKCVDQAVKQEAADWERAFCIRTIFK